ncbi:MAG: hypothetical protein Q9223_002983 [Gallowayella weberi]
MAASSQANPSAVEERLGQGPPMELTEPTKTTDNQGTPLHELAVSPRSPGQTQDDSEKSSTRSSSFDDVSFSLDPCSPHQQHPDYSESFSVLQDYHRLLGLVSDQRSARHRLQRLRSTRKALEVKCHESRRKCRSINDERREYKQRLQALDEESKGIESHDTDLEFARLDNLVTVRQERRKEKAICRQLDKFVEMKLKLGQ